MKKQNFLRKQILNTAVLCLGDSLVLMAGLYLGNWIIFKIH